MKAAAPSAGEHRLTVVGLPLEHCCALLTGESQRPLVVRGWQRSSETHPSSAPHGQKTRCLQGHKHKDSRGPSLLRQESNSHKCSETFPKFSDSSRKKDHTNRKGERTNLQEAPQSGHTLLPSLSSERQKQRYGVLTFIPSISSLGWSGEPEHDLSLSHTAPLLPQPPQGMQEAQDGT